MDNDHIVTYWSDEEGSWVAYSVLSIYQGLIVNGSTHKEAVDELRYVMRLNDEMRTRDDYI